MARTAITPISPNLGLCVGSNIVNGATFNQAVAQADAQYHYDVGIRHVRISIMNYYWTNVYTGSALAYGLMQNANLVSIIEMYLALGIDVQFIVDFGTYDKNQLNLLPGFNSWLAQWAAWAEEKGITRLQINNEQEIRLANGASKDEAYAWMQTLPAVARNAGFTGHITTSVAVGNETSWRAQGLGDYDSLGGDRYGNMGAFVSGINNTRSFFADEDFYMTEFGGDEPSNAIATKNMHVRDPREYAQDLVTKYNWVQNNLPGRVNYLFCWKYFGGEGQDARAAAMGTDELQLFWFYLTGQRPPIAF